MRYRALDANDDYSFGLGGANFLVDSREAVAQAVLTRLRLFAGEWFLDTNEGTPYHQSILGVRTSGTRDQAIKSRVLDTIGVTALTAYSSSVNAVTRDFRVDLRIATRFGEVELSTVLA